MPEKQVNPTHLLDFSEKQSLNEKYKIKLKKSATDAEKCFGALIEKAGYRAMFQKGFLKDYFCIVDFYIPELRLVVEIDGGYHLTKEQIEKDKRRDHYLTSVRKFGVLRFTNEEVSSLTVESLSEILVGAKTK